MTMNDWRPQEFETLLFCHDTGYAAAAEAGGCAGVIVDWEQSGKRLRQSGFDTEINHAGAEELRAMRHAISSNLLCRINNLPGRRVEEARNAVALGADELWLPMLRCESEVEEVLAAVDGRAAVGVLVETGEALGLGRALAQLPLSRVFVGLHDLRIDLGHQQLFGPLVDGTIDAFRDSYHGALGVAGITHPDAGLPVPQDLLLAAMARLRCSFGVARRSFRRDVAPENVADCLRAIRSRLGELAACDAHQTAARRAELASLIAAMNAERAA